MAARPELTIKTEEGKINQLTPPEICPRDTNSLHFLFPLLLDTKSHARLPLPCASSRLKIFVSLRFITIFSIHRYRHQTKKPPVPPSQPAVW